MRSKLNWRRWFRSANRAGKIIIAACAAVISIPFYLRLYRISRDLERE